MRNSEDFSSEPDYQAINSRLIGKPVLSSYLNAREYTPKYEDDEVRQREEGYSGGTDYQALNSQLIGKPVLSSYLSGGRYFPASAGDRSEYIKELLANQEYFRTLADKMKNRDPKDPNAEKLIQGESAAFAGFYPAKMPENDKEQEKWDADWEDRKRAYLRYLDIPTRAIFFPDIEKKEDVWEAKEIPEVLELLMRYPYFRSAASLLGGYLTHNGFVTFKKDGKGDTELVVEKGFDMDALKKFMTSVYYPNVANWSRQVKRELNKKMKPGDDRKEKLEEVKRELREKVNSEAAVTAKIAAANKEEEEIADEINSVVKKMEEKSNKYDGTKVWDLFRNETGDVINAMPNDFYKSDDKLVEFRKGVTGLKTPQGKAYTKIEEFVEKKLRGDLDEILKEKDKKDEKFSERFWDVVIGRQGYPETFIKRLRPKLRKEPDPPKFTAEQVEQKLKLKKKIEMAAEAAKAKEMKKRQATVKKIKKTKAKKKGPAKKEETTTVDEEKPASEKATTQKTKKGRAATKRVASSTTGMKSRPKVGSAALGSKTTKTPRKKGAISPPTSTPDLPANGVRTTPTKKGTRNKNSASASVTLPASVSLPTPKVRGKKSARSGNKKRVTTGKKKTVPASAALPPPPPPPTEETSSTAEPPRKKKKIQGSDGRRSFRRRS